MNEWLIVDQDTGDVWHKDTKAEAEEAVEEFGELRDLEIEGPENGESSPTYDPSGNPTPTTSTEEKPQETHPTPVESDLPDEPRVDEDPVDWLPDHFIDEIKGVPTVNRKGYAVIASKYGVSVTAEPVTLASETDFEYAEFRAIAVTKEGSEYSGFGSAHVNRMDGDDPYLLNELAETRALKRAVAWATGVGLTAAAEMMGADQ